MDMRKILNTLTESFAETSVHDAEDDLFHVVAKALKEAGYKVSSLPMVPYIWRIESPDGEGWNVMFSADDRKG